MSVQEHNQRTKAMAAQRANQMLELFNRGVTYRQIAEQYEITPETVSKIIRREINKIPEENREFARKRLTGTVQVVLRKAMQGVKDGDPHAMQIALNCVDKLARLHGAYAPEVQEVEIAATAEMVRQPRIVFTSAVEVPALEAPASEGE